MKQEQVGKVTIDFVAKGKDESEWLAVLVEEAGDSFDIDEFLYEFQDRLYNCLDAIIDGQLAEKFPDTKGRNIIIRVDCYKLPKAEIKEFFDDFSGGILTVPDYASALASSVYVNNINFVINFD